MNYSSSIDPEQFLKQARKGDADALGKLLEFYRPYLALLARLRLGKQLQAKFDDSDLVQEATLNAHQNFAGFQGTSEKEFTGWLRQILAHAGANLTRHYRSQRRDVRAERRLQDELDKSSELIGNVLIAPASSPSERSHRREQAVILARALEQVSADYREALILHELEGLTMQEVAQRMGRSLNSVQKLLARGLMQMRRLMKDYI